MNRRARRFASTALAMGLLLVACTPSTDTGSSTTTAPHSEEPTTTVPLRTQPLPGPREDRAASVAEEALVEAGNFKETDAQGVWETDVIESIIRWFPADELDQSAYAVYERGDDRVVVISLLPIMSWRGDPMLVSGLAALDSETTPDPIAEGIYRVELPGGVTADLWSTGDGVLAAVSLLESAQTEYLELREAARQPLPVWGSGSCLDVPDEHGLPWAPFPADAVVPCDEPHNAEVIHAEQVGTELQAYDDAAITYQRGYDCDRAYQEVLGPQRDMRPSLITYMPDEDEWDRGDRYLACVVQLEDPRGSVTMSSPMVERDDLEWAPQPGECFVDLGVEEAVDCDDPHAFELLGTVAFDDDAWPAEAITDFRAACSVYLDDLEPGAAEVVTYATGLYPYAFEQGEREIRCFGVAITADGIVQVLGSFTEQWTVLGSGGIAV